MKDRQVVDNYSAVKLAFAENAAPFEPSAGGIPSYIQHRACVLSEAGFEIWWFSPDRCARFDVGSHQWVDHKKYRLSPAARKWATINSEKWPTFKYLCEEVGLDIVEYPDSFEIPTPHQNNRLKQVVMCHTSPRLRRFLNLERYTGSKLKQYLKTTIVQRNMQKADYLLACSSEIAFLTSGFYRIHPDKFQILPHCFSRQAEEGFNLQNSGEPEDYFLFIGNVEFLKGFDLIIQGFIQYREQGGKSRLMVAGTAGFIDPNPQVQHILRMPEIARFLDEVINSQVIFLGKLDKSRLAEIRSRAKAIIVGSRFEAFTMVVGEATLSNCPIILSDRTGWRGLTERFHASRMVNPYDSSDLAQAMFDLDDPKIRCSYQEGANRLAEYLTSEKLYSRTENYYRAMINK